MNDLFSKIQCITKLNHEQASELFKQILDMGKTEWVDCVNNNPPTNEIIAKNIPQFSNFEVATKILVTELRRNGNYGPDYEKIGKYLLEKGKKQLAYYKYGENHAKLAGLIGLVYFEKENKRTKVYLSEIGKIYEMSSDAEKNEYVAKMMFLIPVIYYIITQNEKNINVFLSKYIAVTTANRRTPNVRYIVNLVSESLNI